MTRLVTVSLAAILSLAGCVQPTVPPISNKASLITNKATIMYLGDLLEFSPRVPEEAVIVTIANRESGGQTKTITFEPSSGVKPLVLDAGTLPGLDPKAEVQSFDITVSNSKHTSSTTVDVVSDRSIEPFPSIAWQLSGAMPPGRSPWVPVSDTSGTDALAEHFKAQMAGEQVSMTNAPVSHNRVDIPPHLGAIPPEVVLQEYSLQGRFSKFLVPGVYSPTGTSAVMAPSGFKLIITQTEPAQLVTFTVLPPVQDETSS